MGGRDPMHLKEIPVISPGRSWECNIPADTEQLGCDVRVCQIHMVTRGHNNMYKWLLFIRPAGTNGGSNYFCNSAGIPSSTVVWKQPGHTMMKRQKRSADNTDWPSTLNVII